MEDSQLKADRPNVRHLVERILSLPNLSPDANTPNSLLDAYAEFADGNDHLKACNKLWQAAAQALTAVAQQRNWLHQTPESRHAIATRLANELNDPLLSSCFPAIKSFRDNAELDFMEDFQRKSALPRARYFIERILSQLEPPPNNHGKE